MTDSRTDTETRKSIEEAYRALEDYRNHGIKPKDKKVSIFYYTSS